MHVKLQFHTCTYSSKKNSTTGANASVGIHATSIAN